MSPPKELPFLERTSYRRRRLGDAARLLPVLGMVLFLLPLMWASDGAGTTARSGLYLFGAWGGLIALSFAISLRLARIVRAEDGTGPEGD